MTGHVLDRRLQDLASDIIVEYVDPTRAKLGQPLLDVLALVVDRRVDLAVVDKPVALVPAAGDPDHPAPGDPGDLRRG